MGVSQTEKTKNVPLTPSFGMDFVDCALYVDTEKYWFCSFVCPKIFVDNSPFCIKKLQLRAIWTSVVWDICRLVHDLSEPILHFSKAVQTFENFSSCSQTRHLQFTRQFCAAE